MKKVLFLFILFLTSLYASAQLNDYVRYLKNYYSVDFNLTIKRHALEEYEADDPMFTNELNDQSASLFRIVEIYNFDNKEDLYHAIVEWSYDEFEQKNTEIFKWQDKVNVENLLKLHCDWEEVLYELNKIEKKKKKKKK